MCSNANIVNGTAAYGRGINALAFFKATKAFSLRSSALVLMSDPKRRYSQEKIAGAVPALEWHWA
jgi:hypothetical protein